MGWRSLTTPARGRSTRQLGDLGHRQHRTGRASTIARLDGDELPTCVATISAGRLIYRSESFDVG